MSYAFHATKKSKIMFVHTQKNTFTDLGMKIENIKARCAPIVYVTNSRQYKNIYVNVTLDYLMYRGTGTGWI